MSVDPPSPAWYFAAGLLVAEGTCRFCLKRGDKRNKSETVKEQLFARYHDTKVLRKSGMHSSDKKEIIYVGDPMCAWCFGFASILDEVMERFGQEVSFHLLMGGLRVDNPVRITQELKPRVLENWERVTKTTGQAIHGHLLEAAPEFSYDSRPASIAVVAVRRLKPQAAFAYYKTLHEAFYLRLEDITKPEVLCRLAQEVGVCPEAFQKEMASKEIENLARRDFETAQDYNALAFPAFVLKEGETASILNQGYKPLETLLPHITNWVRGTLETEKVSPGLLIFG